MHSFEEDVKNVKLKRTMDDGRRPIAISHPSLSIFASKHQQYQKSGKHTHTILTFGIKHRCDKGE